MTSDSDDSSSPRAAVAFSSPRYNSGDEHYYDGPRKLQRTNSMEGTGRTRAISLADAEDLDDLWRDVDSMGSRGDMDRSPRSHEYSPRQGGSSRKGNSPHPNDAASGAESERRMKLITPKVIKVDPEKCLRVSVVLKSGEAEGKSQASTKQTKSDKKTPQVDWDKQTMILMRRKRFDPTRGVLV